MRLRFCAVLCVLMVLNGGLWAKSQVFFVANGPMASDFDGNGAVTFADFLHFINNFNGNTESAGYDPHTDLNEDGVTNFSDFLAFSAAYGQMQAQVEPSGDQYIIYVADSDDSSVMALDFNSHLLLDYMPYRGPGGVMVSADQQAIYVAEGVRVFQDGRAHQVQFSVPVESRGKAVLSLDQTPGLCGRSSAGLGARGGCGQWRRCGFYFGGQSTIDLALSPNGATLYVVNQTDQNVVVVDLATATVTHLITIGAIPGEISITRDGTRAYVTNLTRGLISVLDLNTNRVVGQIQLDQESCFGAELSPDGTLLYVSAAGAFAGD